MASRVSVKFYLHPIYHGSPSTYQPVECSIATSRFCYTALLEVALGTNKDCYENKIIPINVSELIGFGL